MFLDVAFTLLYLLLALPLIGKAHGLPLVECSHERLEKAVLTLVSLWIFGFVVIYRRSLK